MKKEKTKGIMIQLMGFLVPLIILAVGFLLLGITPFGERNLMVSDLGTQYVTFFSQFKRIFLEGNGSFLYSFSNGLGDNMLTLAAYYLMSPFNFLLLLFDTGHLPIGISLLILLKISCIGGSMTYYLRSTYQKNDPWMLLFAVAYAFCGYVSIYVYNVMWLDALIWLPLLALGIQRLVKEQKLILYGISLFAVILTNFYLGYMSCLFAVIFYLYESGRLTKGSGIKNYFKVNFPSMKKFVIVSILVAGSTAFLLLPTVFGMLNTGKASMEILPFLPYPNFGLEFFSQLGLGGMSFTSRLAHLPAIFTGSFVTILAVVYFLQQDLLKKEKGWSLFLVLSLFFSMWLGTFNTIWHMFQQAAGFPFRQSYMLSFVLILLAYQVWQKRDQVNIKQWLQATLICTTLMIVGYAAAAYAYLFIQAQLPFLRLYDELIPLHLWISVFIYLFTGLCFILLAKRKNIWLWSSLLIVGTVFELSLNLFLSVTAAPLELQENFVNKAIKYEALLDTFEKEDQDLYRISDELSNSEFTTEEKYNGYNDSLLYGFRSVPFYSSTMNEANRSTLVKLGLFSKNERRISNVGETGVLDLLLNTKYRLTDQKRENATEIANLAGSYVYQNEHVSGVAYAVSEQILDMKLKNKDSLNNQNQLIQAMTGKSTSIFSAVKIVQQTESENKANSYQTQLELQTNGTGHLYAYFPNLNLKDTTIYVNNKKLETKVFVSKQAILDLGYYQQDDLVEVKIVAGKAIDYTEKLFQTLDQAKLNQVANQFSAHALKITTWKDGYLAGSIQMPADSVLYTSIPYDESWQVTVDGKRVETVKLIEGFLGVEVSEGEHQVVMKYQPKGYQVGVYVSIISALLLLGYLIFDYRQKYK